MGWYDLICSLPTGGWMHAHASAHRLLHVCVMFIHQRLYLKSSGSIKLAYCKNSVSRYKNLCSVHCICRALGTVVIGSFEINFQSSCNTYIGCFTLLIIAFFPHNNFFKITLITTTALPLTLFWAWKCVTNLRVLFAFLCKCCTFFFLSVCFVLFFRGGIRWRCSTAVQWLAPSPHSKMVPGLNRLASWGLSMWHVLLSD